MKTLQRFLSPFLVALLSAAPVWSQVTVIPRWFEPDDTVEIRYNSAEGNAALSGQSTLYGHFGLITDQSVDNTDWKYVVGNWGLADANVLMTAEGGTVFSKRHHLRSFHGLPQGEEIQALSMVFRNAAGTITGTNSDGSDILAYGHDGNFHSEFTSHSASQLEVSAATSVDLRGESSSRAALQIKVDGQTVAQAANSKVVEYRFEGAAYGRGTYSISLEVDTGSGYFAADQISVVRRSGIVAQPVPAGMEDGITVLSPTEVHLQLRAPGKPWAFVLGDFNNWQLDSAYLMTPTPDGQTFWIRIDGLNPQTAYRFQYYVGPNGTKIADPYSELILDPWNDQYIDQQTYPNRPFYPSGQSGFVTVFQTGEIPYNWDNSISYSRPDQRDLAIYELLVRDFDDRHTWQSLIDRMEYFEELQINAIQLMPVQEFEGNESWGYNPSHMLAADKYYGPRNDLKRFVEECHRRGIAVILDITLNHQFGQSPLCQLYWDNVNNRPAADNPWFNPIPKHPYNVGYDMNHDSPHTQYFSKRVLKYWLEEYRVDGFRVDMSKGFTQNNTLGDVSAWNAYDQARIDRLTDYGNYAWSITPGAYMILEHFADNSEEAALSNNGFMLWGDMNYSYTQAVMGYANDLSGTLAANRGWWGKNLVAYMESHDEERVVYEAKTYGNSTVGHNTRDLNTAIARSAMGAVLLFSTPGPKMLWQFGELGYDYSIDFCIGDSTISYGCHIGNKPIRWDYFEDPVRRATFNTYADIIYLRKTQAAFRNDPIDYFMGGLVKTIRLQDGNRHFVIVANTDVATQTPSVYFPFGGRWYSLLQADSLQVGGNFQQLILGPGEYRVFCNDNIPVPNAPFSPDLVPDNIGLCDLNGETLNAAPGFGPYTWSNGSTGASLNVTQDGWYAVSITNAFGKVYTDSVYVNIDCVTPAVGTNTPELITANSARFSGEVVSSGSSAVTTVGFVYGTSPNPTLSNGVVSLSPTGNAFSGNASGLFPGITYHVRAFATNAGGTAYGNSYTFTTATGNYDLTFRVDMRNETISPDGVFVAGDFQVIGGYPNNWDPSACEMLDADGDSIYEFTVNLPTGNYEFKFINGNNWNGGESVPGACAVNTNRSIALNNDLAMTAPCFGACGPCDTASSGIFNLTFRVDMRGEVVSANGVHVAGNFQLAAGYASDWNPALTELLDLDGDSIYELTVAVPAGSYEYKFINGNAWGADESVPLACNVNGNRGVSVQSDMGAPLVCFGSCTPCNSGPVPTVDITFQVDMSNAGISPNGIHIAGNFQAAAGFGADWNPATSAMADPDGDSIYTLTVTVPAGTYQYKFINGNAWGSDENVPGSCATGFNREVTATGNMTLPVVCFASCGSCQNLPPQTTYSLTFQVDMGQQDSISPMGVYVVGDFQSEAGFGGDWNPGGSPMTDADNDGIWELTVQVPAGIYEYKFLNGNSWLDEEAVPSYCSFNNNRSFLLSGDTTLPAVCFSACEPCSAIPPSSFDLTFRVDMRNETVSPNGVFVAGNFLIAAGLDSVHWRPDGLQLLDADGDTVYEATVTLPPGVYEYKFLNGNTWSDEEVISGNCLSGTNRVIMLVADQILPEVCFASCGSCQALPPPPASYSLTFQVDMSGQVISPDGIHVAGNFQVAAGYSNDWDPAGSPMTDLDGDSIYTLTVTLPAGSYEYKFINGNAWGSDEMLLGLTCEVNGNRAVQLNADTTLSVVCFESCAPCSVVPSTFDLTFQVDMRRRSISANGIHVAGNFQAAAGYASNWDPAITALTDLDGDSIYTLTVSVPAGNYEYKFINGNAWGNDENMWSQACQVNGNRSVSVNANTVLDAVCFESCSPCNFGPVTSYTVTFRVNMQGETVSADGVHVAGNFQVAAGYSNDWDPAGSPMTDLDGDSIYELTVTIPMGVYEYKFINGNAWGTDETVPVACASGFNRSLNLSSDTTLPAYCFGSCSACISITPLAVQTSTIQNIGVNSAVAGGEVTGDGGSTVIMRGVVYGTMANPDFSANSTSNGSGLGIYSSPLSGLTAATTYFYRAYAINNTDTAYGSVETFTTLPVITAPIVSTGPADAVDANSALLNGSVSSNGGAGITARGFCYALTPSPDLSDSIAMVAPGSGGFSTQITGLQPSTTYYFRAFATNSVGTSFGQEVSFTTAADGPVTCFDLGATAVNVGNYSVRFRWNSSPTAINGYTINLRQLGDTNWVSFFEGTDTSRVILNREPGTYEYFIGEAGLGAANYCLDTFTVACASDIVYTYNAFQAPELGRLGRARVFQTIGGRRLYDIYLVNGSGDTTAALDRRQQNFTNLPADNYSLYVRDAFGCQADSVGQFTILPMDTAYVPNLINAPNNSPNGFRPTWNSVDGIINYQLRVLNVTDGTLVSFITGITDTMRAVTGLTPGKLYRFNVRSRYNNGTANVNSGYSNAVSRNLTVAGNKGEASTNVSEGQLLKVEVYPNPAQDWVNVQAPTYSSVGIYDLNGKQLIEKTVTDAEVQLDLRELAQGVYLIRISNGQMEQAIRLVKQ